MAVSTGYRWYAAESGSLPALLRSTWNASVVTALGDHGRNFAWGGSMALRREVFDRIGVREAWEGALSDDYAVTRAAQRSGKRIAFVPECLIPSYGDCTWHELLEFTTRQILIARVYDASTWRMALVTQSIFNIGVLGRTSAAVAVLDGHSCPLCAGGNQVLYSLQRGRHSSSRGSLVQTPAPPIFCWLR